MRSWGQLRRRSSTNPIRSHQRKQKNASRDWYRRGLRIEQFEERALLSIGAWTAIGPSPIDYGQTENVAPTTTSGQYLNQVTGAVQAVAAHPTNANILYVGTTNGGIWRTDNAQAANPTWTALTDTTKSLSIGSLSFDPTDATGQTLVAGIGRFSDYSRVGGSLTGILRTTNGGTTWTQLDGTGALTGLNIIGVAARGNTILVAADNSLTATYASVGIFRSTDGGATFTQISSSAGTANGLPGGIAYDLAADPTDNNVFYTAVVGATTFGGKNGVYKTTDAGATWTKVSSSAMDALLTSSGTNTTHRVQLTVGKSNQLYVGIVNQMTGSTTLDQLAGVFRSGNGGTSWTQMDVPKITVSGTAKPITFQRVTAATGDALATLPSGQGTVTFSIVADPSNANVVYIGCDAQPAIGAASSIGATDYSGLLFRGDASKTAGSQWVSLTNAGAAPGGTKSNSSPHAQSRDMTFNVSGQLIEADDGGIYLRTSPADRTGDWYSLNGNLQIAEVTTIGYDDISDVAIGAAQGTGVSYETTEGGLTWNQVNKGTGGEVLVDDASLAGSNQSYRYTAGTYLSNFQRQTFDANGVLVAGSTVSPALSVIGTTKTFAQVDGGQYYTPLALNVVDPTRMVIGGLTSVFESSDRCATLTNLGAAAKANAMVYGGYQNGVANANVLWVATSSGVYLRTTSNGTLTKVSTAAALDIAVDPTDWSKAYIVTSTGIQYTANGGATWTDISTGYATAAGASPSGLRGITVVGSGKNAAVVVVGSQGIFVSQSRKLGTWSALGTGLPTVPVLDVTYNAKDNVLLVGTLGRGVWEFSNPLTEIYGSLQLLSVDTNVSTYQVSDHPTVTVSPTSLTLHFNDTTIDSTTLSGIQITRAGANGKFYDPVSNPNDTDDVVVVPGYIGIGDTANEVVIRFSDTLPDDQYRVTIVGQGWDGTHTYYGPDGKQLSPFTTTAGMPVGFGKVTAADTTEYWDGANASWSFNVNLAAQVTAVVPQPITRAQNGTLSQARDQIQVYFSGAMNLTSAQTLSYYSLIGTWNTANTADDFVITPTSAVYDSATKMVTLTFAGDLASLIPNPTNDPAKTPDKCSFRLRIGNAYQAIGSSSGGQGGNIVTSDRSGDSEDITLEDIKSTFVLATNLGNFSTYAPVSSSPLSSSTGQSWVLSGKIGEVSYNLTWPGGSGTPGVRTLPSGATDVSGENHAINGADSTNGITTYYYNFQSIYGTVAGQPVQNEITDAEKQRVREIFSLCTQYFGVQFVETANQGITVAVGDLRAVDATLTMGAGSPDGIASTDSAGPKAIVNSNYTSKWGDAPFGGDFQVTMMHEILHTLGFGHSYDLASSEIMGSSTAGVAGSGETPSVSADGSFPGNGDIVTGQYLYRHDSMDIDLYKFSVDKEGTLNAETIAQRLQNASLLNTALVLYNSDHQVIARNDDYYGHDSFLNLHLTPGTYFIGISASGNSQYDPDVADSGAGGTTEGAYELRLTFQPQVTTQLVDARGAALDGNADGAAGGEYNFWFNVNTESHTLIVDKLSTASTNANGSLAKPFPTIAAAIAAAKAGDIVRVVGNNYDNDNQGHSIQAVAAAGTLLDGQKFTIADATKTFTFELDTNNSVASDSIRVAISSTDSAATVAAKLATAINSVSWIPAGLGQAGVTRYSNGLYACATVTGANGDIVSVDGPTVTINLGTTKLKSTLQDNRAYEIGTNPQGATLSDGANIDLPKGVTMVIDAGALFKMRGANIDVGSANADRTLSALQVLGTPTQKVYFTSYKDETIGVDTYSPPTTAAAGDWGGLVFANDHDAEANDLTWQNLESQGIFVNYVNFADIRYGGGKVSVNSALSQYDPVTMIDSRPTVSHTTISRSADAAMSADPRSLAESEFHDGFGETLYTADYTRVG
ncbi:MAG: hypothetical protein LLG00_02875, partial [Planctomycetaceae bacterium]|nr:hypothetical protein [Planctomycetaceae bacterium]